MKLFGTRSKPSGNLPAARQRPVPGRMDSAGPNRTFSYYAARSQSDNGFGREPVQSRPPLRRLPGRMQRLRKHAAWAVAILLLGAFSMYQLQLSTTPRVVSLTPAADAPFLQDDEVYARAAQELFASSAANRNKLTIDASGIAEQLRRRFPELQAVSVNLPFIGDKATVHLQPAMPALVLAANNGTYIVDSNGRALAEASSASNLSRLKVPTVTDQSSLEVSIGQQVLPRSATKFISTIKQQLQSQKITAQSMTLPAVAGELDVYVAGKPYFIKFNLQQASEASAAQQAGTFLAAIKKLEKEGKAPSQYVDVRLPGRAYSK